MSVLIGLVAVLAAFVILMTTVMTLAFRERRLARTTDITDVAAQRASDGRLLVVIFGSIIGGMILTVVTAVLVFS